jgi:hypothetical protein
VPSYEDVDRDSVLEEKLKDEAMAEIMITGDGEKRV